MGGLTFAHCINQDRICYAVIANKAPNNVGLFLYVQSLVPTYGAATLPAVIGRSRALSPCDFTSLCGLYSPYQRRRECDGGAMTLKSFAWKRHTRCLLTFHCLYPITWPHLTERGLEVTVFPCAQEEEENWYSEVVVL